MTPKAELFGRIEDYCLELLNNQEREEFEKELELNQELREEVELHKNIQSAVLEMDVLDLKGKLDEIQSNSTKNGKLNGSFELLEDLSEFEEFTEELSPEELIESFESLPKVHVYQHERTSNENIHHYYKEQNGSDQAIMEEEDLNGFDMEGLEGLEEAVLETDILNLRDTLQQVAKSVEPQYSAEDIDNYLNGEMGDDILAEFEDEIAQNEYLQSEVNLHKDVEFAVAESDVMDLRNELRNIMDAETSWNVSEHTIEDFIDGILEDESLLEEFSAELKENTDLMAEVNLRENINGAVAEVDIMALRQKLKDARSESEKKEVKSIVMPRFEIGSTKFWRSSVAVVLVLVGLLGAMKMNTNTLDNTYDKYFESTTWASERSVSNTVDIIQQAKVHFQKNEFQEVIDLLNVATVNPDEKFVTQFYKGLSYQNINEYPKAVTAYSDVIDHANNMFIEEAEWYKALCYLKMDKKAEAKKELLAVIDRKGHFEKDAKAVLRKLRYSFK
ncbi:tetratricopeptide repeat protein [uncultured Draconibacterium sp.]|uniref:tetratricopeptide repeat protein n=1 Tax=uncultured Draconibacterium sp. TaxID=1573823 RepID=UPI002AA60678|nr:tetratricopeptide repeat protein [uncultured Draconibacterium sp.]